MLCLDCLANAATSSSRGDGGRRAIWCERISDRMFVYDADEIQQLAKERDKLRAAGKLCGRRPTGSKSA